MAHSDQTPDTVGVIEIELMRLVRHLETFGRKSSLYDHVDRAGYLALRTLDRLGPTSCGGLATALGLDASTVTRQVATLHRAGLVDRRPHGTDRRASTLAITTEGRKAMRHVEGQRRQQIEVLLGEWDSVEQADLARVLAKFNESLTDSAAFDDATGVVAHPAASVPAT